MEKLRIEVCDNFVHFKPSGKVFNRSDLKKINKYTSKEIGPNTADILVRFLQVWNEEEECGSVLPGGTDVSERSPYTVVYSIKRTGYLRRKRGRRRRKPD